MARELQRAPKLADQIRVQQDRLDQLAAIAANERRPHHDTERLLDGLHGVGRTLCVLGRGR